MDPSKICQIIHDFSPSGRIIDVGCGEGGLDVCLAKKLQRKIIGLDIKDAGFVKAKEEAIKAKVHNFVDCVKGNASIMPFKNYAFDMVTLVWTLHHFEDVFSSLKEIKRVLKPEGRILVGDWVVKEVEKKEGCFKFTIEDIQNILEHAGFQLIDFMQAEASFAFIMAIKPPI